LRIVSPSLRSLARIADLEVRVAAAGARLAGDAAATAKQLDALLAQSRAGDQDSRASLLACAQALAADDGDRLALRLWTAAEALRLTRLVHMLESDPAHRAVPSKGRLREVCVPERTPWCSVDFVVVGFTPGYLESSDLASLAGAKRRWVDAWDGEVAHPADDTYAGDEPTYGHWKWQGDEPPRRAIEPRVYHLRPAPHRLMHPSPIAVRTLLASASLRDVLVVASRRPSSAAIAREVARAVTWTRWLEVRHALCSNPFTPTGVVMRFLPTLTSRMVADVCRGPVHPRVREAAHALLAS
jgi:hypothetical protein